MQRMKDFCNEQECDSCIFKQNGSSCHFEDKAGYPPENWEF